MSPTNDAFLSVQKKNVLITEKQNYTDHPTLVYFPPTLDELVARGRLAVRAAGRRLRRGPARDRQVPLADVGEEQGAGRATQRFIALSNAESPIIFEAGARGVLLELQGLPEPDPEEPAHAHDERRELPGRRRDEVHDVPRHRARRRGSTVSRPTYEPPLMFNSPFVKSAWNSGKITIKRGSQSATYDFSVSKKPAKVVH